MVIALVMACALVLGGLTCSMPLWAESVLKVAPVAHQSVAKKDTVRPVLPEPKKIQHPAVELLGTAFKANPAGLVAMGMTRKRAQATLCSIEQFMEFHEQQPTERAQAAYAEKMIKYVIAPTVVFFDRAKSFKDIVKPLIMQSVASCPHLAVCSAADLVKKSLLLGFFDAPHAELKQDELPEFFVKHITDVVSLRAMCLELFVFLQDLYESLPEEVKALYRDLCEQIDKKKAEAVPQS